jgi:hypothetical protein
VGIPLHKRKDPLPTPGTGSSSLLHGIALPQAFIQTISMYTSPLIRAAKNAIRNGNLPRHAMKSSLLIFSSPSTSNVLNSSSICQRLHGQMSTTTSWWRWRNSFTCCSRGGGGPKGDFILPYHQKVAPCLTARDQLAVPWRSQTFQDPGTSQRRSRRNPGTVVASSGARTQPRTAYMMHLETLALMKYTVPM